MVILVIFLLSTLAGAQIAAGNWYLQASSQLSAGSVSQIPQLGGSLSQNGSLISGVLHVSNSKCFEWAAPIPVSGAINGNNVTLTSDGANGGVVSINGAVNSSQIITGTYSIASGCADGDYGTITAVLIPSATGNWSGTISGVAAQPATISFSQTAPGADGYSSLSGAVALPGLSCPVSGTMVPDQSWVLGNQVQAVVNLSDGSILTLNGFFTDSAATADQMALNFSISGGACTGQTGSATYNRQ